MTPLGQVLVCGGTTARELGTLARERTPPFRPRKLLHTCPSSKPSFQDQLHPRKEQQRARGGRETCSVDLGSDVQEEGRGLRAGIWCGSRPEVPSQLRGCSSCPVRCFLLVFKSLAEGTLYGLVLAGVWDVVGQGAETGR